MPVKLDARLNAIATLCRPVEGGTFADIGCDHGKLACHLAGLSAKKVIATDISLPSLAKAAALADKFGATDRVETRAGDGLDILSPEEAETVVIAGLGGDTIARIVGRAEEQGKRFSRYILSPNTHPEKVRALLVSSGLRITDDAVVREGGKDYPVITAVRGEDSLDELQLLFGKFFAEDPGFPERARREVELLGRALTNAPAEAGKRRELLLMALSRSEK